MIELTGKYAHAKIYADNIEAKAEEQILQLLDLQFASDSKIRVMPDVHAGAGCTIGTTMTVNGRAVPNLVGVDIGCGMETVVLKQKNIELEKLDKLIYSKIPSGFSIRREPHRFYDKINLNELHCADFIDNRRAGMSIGTLGGGNHFIEANKGMDGKLYLVVHSGSRFLGKEAAELYQRLGFLQLNGVGAESVKDFKNAAETERISRKLRKKKHGGIPYELSYVSGNLFEEYIHDMRIIQNYADLNRCAIADEIIRGMKLDSEETFTTIHNYIDIEEKILRKGAVSAKKGEKLLIPINMRDGSLICEGKGNSDWNYSAPHGAGRLMSRKEAKNSFTVSEFKKQMQGIYTTSANAQTIDECPMAYKGKDEIIRNIEPTAKIIENIKPIYNFKAGS